MIFGRFASFRTGLLIIAAYLRTVSQYPEINRFVVNCRTYARSDFFVSFIVLKSSHIGKVQETVAKVKLELDDTIFDVHHKLKQAINEARDTSKSNNTDNIATKITKLPIIPRIIIKIIKLLDAYGKLPRSIILASPYHTSLFISNLASINLDTIFHHLCNFGTNSVFISIGKRSDGKIPLGIVIDDRICGGYIWAKALKSFNRYLKTPNLLEQKPEKIIYDVI